MRSYHEKNRSRMALVLVISLFLSGCAGNVPFTGEKQDRTGEMSLTAGTLGLEPDFSYERKKEKPNIQVDLLGYLPKSTKTAIFQGKELPESFRVMEKESGECVYEGEIRPKEGAVDGVYTGYGNFTDLEREGNYYIQCDKIGCSCYFAIGKEVYLEKAESLGEIIKEAKYGEIRSGLSESGEEISGAKLQEIADICKTVSYLLTAYEIYPELIEKMWGSVNTESETLETEAEEFFQMLRSETDWLLSIQDEITGGIYENEEATAAFAGTMAKFSYLYQQYDWDYANICLKAAAKAWRGLGSTQSETLQNGAADTGRFYAASELYRASNEIMYHNYILQNQESLLNQNEDFYRLMGKVTYLSTKRKVDQELCGQIMDGLMKEAEDITKEAKSGLFLVGEEETDVILWDMTVLALANYAIMNHEYVTVIENHVHYLMGRNERAEILPEIPESREAAGMLFLFSVIEAEREIVEASENKE